MKAIFFALFLSACAEAFVSPGSMAKASPVSYHKKRAPFVVEMLTDGETEVAAVSQLSSSIVLADDFDVVKAGLAVFALVATVGAVTLTTQKKDTPAAAPAPVAASEKKPAPAPAPEPAVDLSIPYDAAAKMAYDASDKSMAYTDFKQKYEADAVADATAKKAARDAPVVDLSIPYDAAAKMAYDASDKSMAYNDFKAKYEADAVADATAKKAARDAAK